MTRKDELMRELKELEAAEKAEEDRREKTLELARGFWNSPAGLKAIAKAAGLKGTDGESEIREGKEEGK